jgi:DNA-binding Lrp family transcriptional regulator
MKLRYLQPTMKPRDLFVLLKLSEDLPSWTFDSVAHELNLSSSSVHRSVQRVAEAGLFDSRRREVNYPAFREFLVHGARYVFPPRWGGEARGLPTAWAAPPIADQVASSGENVPVWADPEGKVRGIALEPLDPAVPDAARRDKALWELLALFDSIRVGATRERSLAGDELNKRLSR